MSTWVCTVILYVMLLRCFKCLGVTLTSLDCWIIGWLDTHWRVLENPYLYRVATLTLQNACEKLVSRLEAVAELISSSEGKPTWHELISKALDAGVDLQARGRVYPKASPLGPFQYVLDSCSLSNFISALFV